VHSAEPLAADKIDTEHLKLVADGRRRMERRKESGKKNGREWKGALIVVALMRT